MKTEDTLGYRFDDGLTPHHVAIQTQSNLWRSAFPHMHHYANNHKLNTLQENIALLQVEGRIIFIEAILAFVDYVISTRTPLLPAFGAGTKLS